MSGTRAVIAGAAAALLLAGCGGRKSVREGSAKPAPTALDTDWHRVVTPTDRDRVRNWRSTWLTALAEARAADPTAIARDPLLFGPDRGLGKAMPPVGDYRCRTFKLGTQGAPGGRGGGRGFTAYPWFDCGIDDEGGLRGFFKTSGTQRPVGLLFADGDARGIFLGTLVLGDESRPLQYGRDAGRDMAGIIERIGERRWRLAFPAPRFESKLDVIEIVPAR